MKCKNCGAVIHEGDTFCRTCAAPINEKDYINHDVNQATSSFANESIFQKVKKNIKVVKEPSYHYDEPVPKEINNKDIIDKDANNRTKATIINFVGLAIVLIVFIILCLVFFKIISNL